MRRLYGQVPYGDSLKGRHVMVVLFLSAPILDDELRRAVAHRIREALRLADISLTKAAHWMGMGPQDFEKALNGERALSVWRLLALPPEYHQHYHLIELRDRGLPDYAKTAIKMLPALEPERKRA